MTKIFYLLINLLNLEPCATEDATRCYWDASAQGNGEGSSFIAITEQTIIYFRD